MIPVKTGFDLTPNFEDTGRFLHKVDAAGIFTLGARTHPCSAVVFRTSP
jgi:hypothetical protein